jgi:hypothetical protein
MSFLFGVHQGHAAAGGIENLSGPNAVGTQDARDPACYVINRGRDVSVGVLNTNGPVGDVERLGRGVQRRGQLWRRALSSFSNAVVVIVREPLGHARHPYQLRYGSRPHRSANELIAPAGPSEALELVVFALPDQRVRKQSQVTNSSPGV